MTINDKIITTAEDNNKRLDVFLSEKLLITRSQVQKLIERDLVLLNEKLPKKAGDRLREGDKIELTKVDLSILPVDELEEDKFKDLKLKIVSEKKDYLVVEKPAGLLVHPTEARESNTLIDLLLEKYPEIKKVRDVYEQAEKSAVADRENLRPGIVHRLDKEASGLMVVARTQRMFDFLKKQFQDREVEKIYQVLVYGELDVERGMIDFDIDRGIDGRMVARPRIDLTKVRNVSKVQPGKKALSEYEVEKKFTRFTLLKIKIHTGRTHQIRVHMLAFNHPVVGDPLYFNKHLAKKGDKKLARLFLHAAHLCFTDLGGEKQCFDSKLPKELKDYLKDLK